MVQNFKSPTSAENSPAYSEKNKNHSGAVPFGTAPGLFVTSGKALKHLHPVIVVLILTALFQNNRPACYAAQAASDGDVLRVGGP